MVHQSYQLTKIGASAQINGSLQPGVMMIFSAYLNELDAPVEMVNDRLVALRLPPLDANIILSTGGHDPKRGIFASDFVNLRGPCLFLIGQVNVTLESCRFD